MDQDSNPNKRKRTETDTTNPNANEQRQRVKEDNVALFRTYHKLNVKLIRSEQHHQYLNKCLSRDIVPKTLRSTIQPQVPDTTPKFVRKWEEAQLIHGRSLVKLLATYWEDRCKNIMEQIEELKQELQESTETEEMEHITQLIESTKLSVEKEINEKQFKPRQK